MDIKWKTLVNKIKLGDPDDSEDEDLEIQKVQFEIKADMVIKALDLIQRIYLLIWLARFTSYKVGNNKNRFLHNGN